MKKLVCLGICKIKMCNSIYFNVVCIISINDILTDNNCECHRYKLYEIKCIWNYTRKV